MEISAVSLQYSAFFTIVTTIYQGYQMPLQYGMIQKLHLNAGRRGVSLKMSGCLLQTH